MNYDQSLDPATDQHLVSADDTSYSTSTTCDNEGAAGLSGPDDVVYNELQRSLTDIPSSTTTLASTYASDNSSPSRKGHFSHSATANNEEASGSGHQSTNEDEFLNPSDAFSLNDQDAAHWSGNALQPTWQATPQLLFTSWEHKSFTNHGLGQSDNLATWANQSSFDVHQLTHGSSSNDYAAQAPTVQHPELSYVGMQFGEPYSELMDTFSVLMAPDSAQQLGNVENVECFGDVRLLAEDASSLIQMPSTDSESYGLKSDIPARGAESEVVKCESCTAVFRGVYARGNYRRHRRQKHTNYHLEYVCDFLACSKHFKRSDALLKHYRRHHPHVLNEPKFRDDRDTGHYRDNTSDETQDQDQDHLSITLPPQTSGDSRTLCTDTTPATTRVVAERPSIEVLRKDEEGFRCDICQKRFNRAAELRRHKSSVHNLNSQQYFCAVPGCKRASRPFPRKDKLADHTARVHNLAAAPEAFENDEEVSEATYRCDNQGCEREFDQRANLLRHQRTHTGKSERPYKCAQCGQSFLYPKDLRRHEATHLHDADDDKPIFHCEVASCEYGPGRQGFSRKDGMVRHLRRFHPELYVI